MFFISKDARLLLDAYQFEVGFTWEAAFVCERAAMRFDPRTILGLSLTFGGMSAYMDTRPTRADALEFDLAPYEEAYMLICQRYLVADYGRVDALKLAMVAHDYPVTVIEQVAHRCRNAGNFSIPYLATALQNEGAKEIDKLRREQQLNELVASSSAPPPAPLKFPGKAASALVRAEVQADIKRIVRKRR